MRANRRLSEVLGCALVGLAVSGSSARAQDPLQVAGPPGTGSARQIYVWLADRCLGDEDLLVSSDASVELTPLDRGSCGRWVLVRAATPRSRVPLVLRSPQGEARAEIAMGEGTLSARTDPEPPAPAEGEDATLWTGAGASPFLPSEPLQGLACVSYERPGARRLVVHAGQRAGLLAIPLVAALPRDGLVRPLVAVVVAGPDGRLSDTVALQVSAEGLTLQGFRWVMPGLAVIDGQADDTWEGERGALTIAAAGERLDTTVPLQAALPRAGSLRVPAEARRDEPLALEVSLDVPEARARLRCGDEIRSLDARCPTSVAGPLVVTLEVSVAGEFVPFARATAAIVEPPPPPPDATEPPARWCPELALLGTLDGWLRGGGGARVGLSRAVHPRLRLGLGLAYVVGDARTEAGIVSTSLVAAEHALGVALRAEVPVWRRLFLSADAGFDYVSVVGTLDQRDVRTHDVRPRAALSLGLALTTFRSYRVAMLVGGSLAPSRVMDAAWSAPIARGHVEVQLALPR